MRPPFIAIGLALACVQALAAPTGGNVVAGSAEIRQNASGSQTDIVQRSQRAAVEWASFDLKNGEGVFFRNAEFGRNSWTLNRINDAKASDISGRIWADGNIILLNSNGVIFNQGARVDVGGLIASTARLANEDFMAGRLNFTASERFGGSIINRGTINVADSGIAMFVAPHVRNEGGLIFALRGRVVLASGSSFEVVDLAGDGLINLKLRDNDVANLVDAAGNKVDALVENRDRGAVKGQIVAPSGKVVVMTPRFASGLIDNAINLGGVVRADAVEGGPDGSIRLVAYNGGVSLDGQIAAPKAAGAKAGTFSLTRVGEVLTVDESIANAAGRILATGTHVSLESTQRVEVVKPIDGRGDAIGAGLRLIGGDVEIRNDIYTASGAIDIRASGRIDMARPTGGVKPDRAWPLLFAGSNSIRLEAERKVVAAHLVTSGDVTVISKGGNVELVAGLGRDIDGLRASPLNSLTIEAKGNGNVRDVGNVAEMHDVLIAPGGSINIDVTRSIVLFGARPGIDAARAAGKVSFRSSTLGAGDLANDPYYWGSTRNVLHSEFRHVGRGGSRLVDGRWIDLNLTDKEKRNPTLGAPAGPINVERAIEPRTPLDQYATISGDPIPDVIPAAGGDVAPLRFDETVARASVSADAVEPAEDEESGYSGGRGLALRADLGRSRASSAPSDVFRVREHVVELGACEPVFVANSFFAHAVFGQSLLGRCQN